MIRALAAFVEDPDLDPTPTWNMEQLPVTPAPEDLMAFSGLHRYFTYAHIPALPYTPLLLKHMDMEAEARGLQV